MYNPWLLVGALMMVIPVMYLLLWCWDLNPSKAKRKKMGGVWVKNIFDSWVQREKITDYEIKRLQASHPERIEVYK